MRRQVPVVVVTVILLALSMAEASAGSVKDQALINIESYTHVRVDFQDGEALELSASIQSLSFPINVLLIKGEAEFARFRTSEEFDLISAREGNISELDDTITYVREFSKLNITDFSDRMRIGEHDSYFLVIMLHRDLSMDPQEVLSSMATLVNYDVSWTVLERELPFLLIAVMVLFLLLGVALIGYYLWQRSRMVVPEDQPYNGPAARRQRSRSEMPQRRTAP